MFDLLFPRNWSTLKKLIWLKAAALSSAVVKTVTAAIVHIRDALAGPAQNVTIAIEPVQSGSGDPSPDNVRPITGWTGCNIYHRGKNLFDEANATQYQRYISYTNGNSAEWKTSSDSRSYAIEVIPGQTYTISLNADPQSTIFRVAAIKVPPTTAGTIASTHAFSNSGNPVYEITFTMREGEKWLVIQVGKSFSDERKAKIQVEVGSRHTDYEAYSAESQTYPIAFQDSAGTVYGGTLDVTTGVLTVTWGAVDLGSIGWIVEAASIGKFRTAVISNDPVFNNKLPAYTTNFICSRYKNGGLKTYSYSVNGEIWYTNSSAGYPQNNIIRLTDSTQANVSAADFKTHVTGQTLCYELATPQTYQLTPQEVTMLLGNNTLWADTGDISLTYMADGTADDLQALNILLGGRYQNLGAPDEATDAEALNILLGR